jgi:predicted RNA binding protein YcfA (HicA-like mRNA interferase family)
LFGSAAAIANCTTRQKPGTVTVAGKPSVDVPPGTLNSVLKQAGLKE